FAAHVAVNALVVHVVFARHVLRIFVCSVCHKFVRSIWLPQRGMASEEFSPQSSASPQSSGRQSNDCQPMTGNCGLRTVDFGMLSPCIGAISAKRKSSPRSARPRIPLT